MSLDHQNILTLNENIKAQQTKINKLEEQMNRLSNTVAILQSELTVAKQLAAYSHGTGPTS